MKSLNTLYLIAILISFAFTSCTAEEKMIYFKKNSGESADYNQPEIINVINKQYNKVCLAVFYKDVNQKYVFFEKVIESPQGKQKVANWNE